MSRLSGTAFADGLRRAAAARGLAVTAEQAAAMAVHQRLLVRWNRAAKLTSLDDDREILDRHFLESLEAVRFLPAGPGRLVDVGSGGGFPALPVLVARPEWSGLLLEPATRKRAFLKEVIRELGLGDRVRAVADRLDRPGDLSARGPFDALTARAVGGLETLLAAAAVSLRPQGQALLFVGEAAVETLRAGLPSGLAIGSIHPLPGRRASYLAALVRA